MLFLFNTRSCIQNTLTSGAAWPSGCLGWALRPSAHVSKGILHATQDRNFIVASRAWPSGYIWAKWARCASKCILYTNRDTVVCKIHLLACVLDTCHCIQDTLSSRALGLSAVRPSARASKGILHTTRNTVVCKIPLLARRTLPKSWTKQPAGQARRATIGYLVYKYTIHKGSLQLILPFFTPSTHVRKIWPFTSKINTRGRICQPPPFSCGRPLWMTPYE